MREQPPLWDDPSDPPAYCRIFAGTAWLVLGAGYFILLVGSWGFLSAAILSWALGALPAAYFTFRWLQSQGGGRLAAAGLLVSCCIALTTVDFVLFKALVDWKQRLPYIVAWLPLGLSLWGAVLGFVGQRRNPGASA